MPTALITRPCPATDTFKESDELIKGVCYNFRARFPYWEFDELYGEACYVFVKVHRSYSPDCGSSFDSFLSTCIWRKLSDMNRTRYQREKKLHRVNMPEHYEPAAPLPDDQDEIYDMIDDRQVSWLEQADIRSVLRMLFYTPAESLQLVQDAKTLLNLIADCPSELLAFVRTGKHNGAMSWRVGLKNYAREELSWTSSRIEQAFALVQDMP